MKNTTQAETIAVLALTWISADPELSAGLLGMSGADPSDLRTQAQNPEFLGFVLDYILQQDEWVIAFCDAHNLGYDSIAPARATLPGGDIPNWT